MASVDVLVDAGGDTLVDPVGQRHRHHQVARHLLG